MLRPLVIAYQRWVEGDGDGGAGDEGGGKTEDEGRGKTEDEGRGEAREDCATSVPIAIVGGGVADRSSRLAIGLCNCALTPRISLKVP